MNGCVYRTEDDTCLKFTDEKYNSVCVGDVTECEYRKMSNADRIRGMTDDDLSDLLSRQMCGLCILYHYCKQNRNNRPCPDVTMEWLQKEVDNG